jgi:hypothetical protein
VRVYIPTPSPMLQDHPLSAVRDCLLNTFAATLHTCRPSPPSATRGRAMSWWQGTHLKWMNFSFSDSRFSCYLIFLTSTLSPGTVSLCSPISHCVVAYVTWCPADNGRTICETISTCCKVLLRYGNVTRLHAHKPSISVSRSFLYLIKKN